MSEVENVCFGPNVGLGFDDLLRVSVLQHVDLHGGYPCVGYLLRIIISFSHSGRVCSAGRLSSPGRQGTVELQPASKNTMTMHALLGSIWTGRLGCMLQ